MFQDSCPACGSPLPPASSSTAGLCPACLLKQVLADDAPAADPESGRSGSPHLELGVAFGRFEIVRVLGRGGMATVYEAREPLPLDRNIALKILLPEFLYQESFAARFENEARLVARLEHLHIVPIFASGIDDAVGLPWMSMRLMPGGSLAGRLGRGLGVERVTQILRGVAEALDFAHANGVLHRDIKPSNILLDDTDGACLSDFGLARLVARPDGWTLTGTVAGTPHYMSPEQARGNAIDFRSDLYSLGVVAYEMLAGRTPFEGESPVAIGLRHIQDPPPVPSRALVPDVVFKVLQKALAKNPADRWPSAVAFVDALEVAAARARTKTIPLGRVGARTIVGISTAAIGAAALAGVLASRTPPAGLPASTAPAWLPSRVFGAVWTALPPGEVKKILRDPGPPPPVLLGSRLLAFSPLILSTARTGVLPRDEEPEEEVGNIEPLPNTRGVVPVPDKITAPRIITSVTPEYPPIARRIQAQGNVVLRGTVEPDGRVTNLSVVRTANRVLNDAAIKAAAQYRYEPGRRNGAAVRSEVEIQITFKLE